MEEILSQAIEYNLESNKLDSLHTHQFIEDKCTGFYVCTLCGEVSNEIVFSNTLPYNQFISSKGEVGSFRSKAGITSSDLKRALKLEKIVSWSEKKSHLGQIEIKRVASIHLFASFTIQRAIYLFEKMIKNENFSTHFIELMAQISLYYAAKESFNPVIMEDIVNIKKFSISLAQKYYYELISTFRLPNLKSNLSSFLHRFGSELKLDSFTIQFAEKVLQVYMEYKNTSGCDNRGIAAGVLYFSCNQQHLPTSQRAIAKVSKVSEITIRSRFKEIMKLHRAGKTDEFIVSNDRKPILFF